MLKFGLFAAAVTLAAPAFAQEAAPAQAPTGPQAAVQQTAMAYGQCLETGARSLDPSVSAEAGATSVLAGCTAQRQALDAAVAALIETIPEEHKATARQQFQTQMSQGEARLAAAIQQMRAAPAPAPQQ